MSEEKKAPAAGHEEKEEKKASDEKREDVTVDSLMAEIKTLKERDTKRESTISNLYKESKTRQAKIKEYEDRDVEKKKKNLADETDVKKIKEQLNQEKLDIITAKDKVISSVTSALRDKTVIAEISRAAAKYDAYKPEQVIQLCSNGISLDDNHSPFVIDKDNRPRIGVNGDNMSIDAYVKEFLDNNPNLVKGSQNAGSGSNGSAGNNSGISVTNIGKMSRKEYKEKRNDVLKALGNGTISK